MKTIQYAALVLAVVLVAFCAGCAVNQPGTMGGTPAPETGKSVKLPAKLKMGSDGQPTLSVYVKDTEKTEDMPLEKYLEGVLAGEMKNDWPMEALKAQAILARTFVLKFLEEKQSKYKGADISTDIEEAQAYNAEDINDRIRQAVRETRGLVLSAKGELPFSWFHAHSGGLTAGAKEGLEYEKAEPAYVRIVSGRESEKAPGDVARWTATFPAADVLRAAIKTGASGKSLSSIELGQRGESGRVTTLIVNGDSVPAGSFRIALGSTEMKSTLLEEISLSNGKVTIKGKGYGHGVGMSQWGAYGMAEQGEKAEQIVTYYFNGVEVVSAW